MGANTSARGRPGTRVPSAIRATTGIEKPRVLPLPVLPRANTSRPPRVSGRVAAWIGKGASIPPRVRTLTRGAGTPSEANVVVEVEDTAVIRLSRLGSGEIADGQNRSP
ncbi:Uncharacterised protein [Mycobacteroides abscessus subsp. abscessus]|nr:Uncharacterised protein [Mycobacteroides abscessus subsp. abscessus]